MKIKLTVSYDGTNYSGWQIQPNSISTVQEVLENKIKELTGESVRVTGSGRTDAGVHAEGQVVSFELKNCTIPAEKFYRAINVILPTDIKAVKSEPIDDNFNACRRAKRKTYRYKIYEKECELPLKERFSVRVNRGLDYDKMISASKLFIGKHDFKAFCSSGSGVKTTEREIYNFTIERDGIDTSFTVTGNGFLYNMVRIMVGTLLKIGYGKMTEGDLINMLNGGRRDLGGDTLPSKGLCLISVEY